MSLESSPAGPRRVVRDPLALRALAHPLRLKLGALVAREGTITAAEAARQLGISQALASHHLRQLAKYGFVEPAEAGDNRARPWRTTAVNHRWEPGDSADGREASDLVETFLAEAALRQLTDWQRRRDQADPRLAEQSGVSQNLVYLTPDELAAFNRAWERLIAPLVRKRPLGDAAARPADAIPVDVTLLVVPVPPTAAGN
ncbi:helix-turn-helix domain-containing protein [Catenuloplanes atrovinosus]|uniref:DNA-binding transcriptional ArsR family regulator n=1 Tax=Catenuloplanes atrovinosus TaxID=137266 RepID=A0AAE3YJM3_9ACTN|nr:helix-turn-helix domain-containing protein [Catenuloplanes atrovinosus]MDR7274984.1 DNA-binding transcriptional ArsR family regulator [Catenuloplanes atrovinosus]